MGRIHEVTLRYLLQDDVVSIAVMCWIENIHTLRRQKKEGFRMGVRSCNSIVCSSLRCVPCIWRLKACVCVCVRFLYFHTYTYHRLSLLFYILEKREEVIGFALFIVCVYLFYLLDLDSTILSVVFFLNKNKINYLCVVLFFYYVDFPGCRYL